MITFTFMDEGQKEQWLPRLFELLYENMHRIAPGECSYEQEKQQWMENVSPALEKAPRKVILSMDGDVLAGYVQYYTNGDLLMIEEVQIAKKYQRTTLFYGMYKFLTKALPKEIKIVEAYAEKRNLHSQRIMGKLGMTQIGEDGPFVHFRGSASRFKVS